MTEPRWIAQRMPADGGSASDGIRKQLGAPALDPLAVLVREAAQNSWDASDPDSTAPTVFRVHVDELNGDRLQRWRDHLVGGDHVDQLALSDVLKRDKVTTITISDRGTTGLGGPVRSDLMPATGTSPDFVNFVRNVGVRRDKQYGGGTYGFGKAAFFRIAQSDTIVIDSLCSNGSRPERRLIGSALGVMFNSGGARFTGRQFWGVETDGVADPLLDDTAARTAKTLGLPGFDSSLGTDVVIVGAELGENPDGSPRTIDQAAAFIVGAALWYLWPNMMDRGEGPRLMVQVQARERELDVPDPLRHPRLKLFAQALRAIDNREGLVCTRQRAPRNVGTFHHVVGPSPTAQPPGVDAAAPFDGPAHHCARMRHVGLVVDYLEGPALPDPIAQWGAVFQAHPDVDEILANAEPPTHDSWETKHLTGTDRGVVQKTKSFVREAMAGVVPAPVAAPGDGAVVPLGQLAGELAKALPGGTGFGGSPSTDTGGENGGNGGNGGGRGGRRFTVVDGPRLITRPELAIVMTVEFDASATNMRFRMEPEVTAATGRERTAPIGAAMPQVFGWTDAEGNTRPGAVLTLAPDDARRWTARIFPAPDTSTTVTVRPIGDDGA